MFKSTTYLCEFPSSTWEKILTWIVSSSRPVWFSWRCTPQRHTPEEPRKPVEKRLLCSEYLCFRNAHRSPWTQSDWKRCRRANLPNFSAATRSFASSYLEAVDFRRSSRVHALGTHLLQISLIKNVNRETTLYHSSFA